MMSGGLPLRARQVLVALLGLAVLVVLLGMVVGSGGLESLAQIRGDPLAMQVVRDIRLPRTLGALLAGALLGLAGCVAQGLFRNPLADPYLLGSSSGAALGVALAFVFMGGTSSAFPWLGQMGITGAAFLGAMLAVLLTLLLARGVSGSVRLLLAGVIVGVVLGAFSHILQLLNPSILQGLLSFSMGTTGFVDWYSCALMAVSLLLCLAVAWSLARVLDGLVLGEATARTLGLPLGVMQAALVAVMALATGAAVAQTGLLAFVGLAAPHLVRSIVKLRHQWLLLLSSLMGAVLLGLADLLARGLLAPQELPVGVLTALLGGGYLLWLMHRSPTFRAGRGGT